MPLEELGTPSQDTGAALHSRQRPRPASGTPPRRLSPALETQAGHARPLRPLPLRLRLPRRRRRGNAFSKVSGGQGAPAPGKGRQGARGPVPEGAGHPSSLQGGSRTSPSPAKRAPPCRRSCGPGAGPGWACCRRPRPPRCWSRPAGAACRAGSGAPWTAGPWGARPTWRAPPGTRRGRFLLLPAAAGSPSAPAEAPLRRSSVGRPCTRRAGSRRRPRARLCSRPAAPRWAAPRRAPPLRARARRGPLAPWPRAAGQHRHAARPRAAPPPRRLGRPGRRREMGGRAGGGAGSGEAGSSVPARRPAGSAPCARGGCPPSVQPRLGERPRGDCALSTEQMFNGNQRWKKTLEDPVVPFHPRLPRRPRAALLGSGVFGTRMWVDIVWSLTRNGRDYEAYYKNGIKCSY